MRQDVIASEERLNRARQIADEVRQNEAMHRFAMEAVFVLEDCHEGLVRRASEQAAVAPKQKKAAR